MIRITSGDRVVYPDAGFTKRQVVEHYARVAEAMLPHVVGRPLTLFRHPRGLSARGFFQKQAMDGTPDSIGRIAMPKRDGEILHASVTDADGLCWLANHGTIELHVPLSRVPTLAAPDRLVLDLDPEAGDLDGVRRAAHAVHALLDALGWPSTPLASGGKGYHVYVALEPGPTGGALHEAAHILATLLAQRHPDALTTEVLKKNRQGRVFVDWMRNGWGSTVVAPFSLRARPGAPVAVPIRWDEVDALAPDHFRLDTIEARLAAGDPLLALPPVPASDVVEQCRALREAHGIELVHVDRFGRVRS